MDNERCNNSSVNVGGSVFKMNFVYDKMKKFSDSWVEKCDDYFLERNFLDGSVSDLGFKFSVMYLEQGLRSQKYKNFVKSLFSKVEKLKVFVFFVIEFECDVFLFYNDIKICIMLKMSCDFGIGSILCWNNMKGFLNLI